MPALHAGAGAVEFNAGNAFAAEAVNAHVEHLRGFRFGEKHGRLGHRSALQLFANEPHTRTPAARARSRAVIFSFTMSASGAAI